MTAVTMSTYMWHTSTKQLFSLIPNQECAILCTILHSVKKSLLYADYSGNFLQAKLCSCAIRVLAIHTFLMQDLGRQVFCFAIIWSVNTFYAANGQVWSIELELVCDYFIYFMSLPEWILETSRTKIHQVRPIFRPCELILNVQDGGRR